MNHLQWYLGKHHIDILKLPNPISVYRHHPLKLMQFRHNCIIIIHFLPDTDDQGRATLIHAKFNIFLLVTSSYSEENYVRIQLGGFEARDWSLFINAVFMGGELLHPSTYFALGLPHRSKNQISCQKANWKPFENQNGNGVIVVPANMNITAHLKSLGWKLPSANKNCSALRKFVVSVSYSVNTKQQSLLKTMNLICFDVNKYEET